ncbi:MAG: hypothetical protein L0Y54_10335 [Sporichthyaceae bacterium]|nr:hypothetical protein [Sporichthyaceae bacterium]
MTLGGRLLLIQDDTGNIKSRLSRLDDLALAGLSAKISPIIAAELRKLPAGANLTPEQVGQAVAFALRKEFPPDQPPNP